MWSFSTQQIIRGKLSWQVGNQNSYNIAMQQECYLLC